MAWATAAQARRFMNVTSTSVISDDDITDHIITADRETRRFVLVMHYDESLSGSVDGTNTQFLARHKPIGDKDMSVTVDGSDVTVFTIDTDDTTGFRESTSVSVSSLVARDGIITLSSAPDNIDDVTMDYASIDKNIDMGDVNRASSMMTAIFGLMQISGGAASGYSYTAGRFKKDKGTTGNSPVLIDKLIRQWNSLVASFGREIRKR